MNDDAGWRGGAGGGMVRVLVTDTQGGWLAGARGGGWLRGLSCRYPDLL